MQRLEEARATEGAALSAELAAQREAVAGELSAKDNKINDLVEELGATQALLTDKEAALQEVRMKLAMALIRLLDAPGARCMDKGQMLPGEAPIMLLRWSAVVSMRATSNRSCCMAHS